ncbi:uncharacterized protein C1orf159 homolog [Pseudophryne corroboree]|uniref:uncharacterized protein C1orf159 homolog n=1 Tax=Pseudophryne corroboree TaxID=495146 RepID=UPI003081CB82
MAVPCILLLGELIMDSMGELVNSLVSDCCSARFALNDSCPMGERCSPGCYRVWSSNGSTSCIKCANETNMEISHNLTECRNITADALEIHTNISITPSVPHHLSNPGIAASLLLGTLFIGLFLVLSVALFFYLKRSHMLPEIFYRRNRASIFEPSEMASMIPDQSSSVRKQRYVRRERTHKAPAPVLLDASANTKVSNI